MITSNIEIDKTSSSSGFYIIYGIRGIGKKKYKYIGQTRNQLQERIKNHIENTKKNKHHNPILAKFIMDCNFLFEYDVLEICDCEIADDREQFYIDKYWDGGNIFNIQMPVPNKKHRYKCIICGKPFIITNRYKKVCSTDCTIKYLNIKM